jgi:hypothetical protein
MIAQRSPAITESSVKRPENGALLSSPFRWVHFVDNVFVASDAVLAQADPVVGLVEQIGNLQIQTNGVVSTMSSPSVGTRVSVVADPENAAKKCWLLKCASTDADTAGTGAKRTEFSSYPNAAQGIQDGEAFLACFATRTGESWASLSDDQLISQIHAGSGSPIFAVYVSASGLRVSIRRGAVGSAEIPLYTDAAFAHNQWLQWVVHGRTGVDGFLRIWRNGALIVDYAGAFGYSDGSINYLKAGYYHWTNAGNDWDAALPERTLFYKGPWIVDSRAVTPAEAISFIDSV